MKTKGLKERQEYVIDFSGRKNEYINYGESIRILESKNHFKKVVAREISNYLSAISRQWDTTFREDVNAKSLTAHLNMKFPEFATMGLGFKMLHSQAPFDIVSFGAGVIIELKSVRDGIKDIMGNASIYPDKVAAKDALSKNFRYPSDSLKEKVLDVLVACVTHKNDVVTGYAIVDGSYWEVTNELYLACRDYFPAVNALTPKINEMLSEENLFARYLYDGMFGDGIKLSLRKLITLTNPVGRLNVLGHWGISS